MYYITNDEKIPRDIRDHFCPSSTSNERDILAWLSSVRHTYTSFIQQSPNYKRFAECIDILSDCRQAGDGRDRDEGDQAGDSSLLRINNTKRQMLEMVATLSDVDPEVAFTTSDTDLKEQTNILTNYYSATWQHPDTRIRRTLVELMQYAICSEGYLEPVWEGDAYRSKLPGLRYNAYNINEVYFSEVPKDRDIQKVTCTTIKREVPLNMACLMYPDHASHFTIDNDKPSWVRTVINTISQYTGGGLAVAFADAAKRKEPLHSPLNGTVNIYYSYIIDISYNNTNKPIEMGDSSRGLSYTVPFVGQQIDTGIVDPSNGKLIKRKATPNDAMLYPYRRLIIHTDKHIISDGSSPWSHGMTPLVRFSLVDWFTDNLGDSTAVSALSIDDTIEKMYRAFEDTILNRLSPNINLPGVNPEVARKFNPRKRGEHFQLDIQEASGIRTLLPYQHYQILPQDLLFLQKLEEKRDYIIGKPQIDALAKAQQIPSAETFDLFLELSGPYTTFISKNVEESLREVGNLVGFIICQFATTKRRFELLGRDGLSKEDWEYDPTLLPAPKSGFGDSSISMFPTSTIERARTHGQRFTFKVVGGSAYKITDRARQLLILNASRDPRMPMSPWFVAKQLGIDLGGEPTHLHSDYDKYLFHLENMSKHQSVIQAQAAIIQAQTQLAIQKMIQQSQQQDMMDGLGALLGGEMVGGETEQPNYPPPPHEPQRTGRPPSNQSSPRLETKDGGTRTTIATS